MDVVTPVILNLPTQFQHWFRPPPLVEFKLEVFAKGFTLSGHIYPESLCFPFVLVEEYILKFFQGFPPSGVWFLQESPPFLFFLCIISSLLVVRDDVGYYSKGLPYSGLAIEGKAGEIFPRVLPLPRHCCIWSQPFVSFFSFILVCCGLDLFSGGI